MKNKQVYSLQNRAVFFDRDGTLNETFVRNNKPYGPTSLKDLELLPDAPLITNKLHGLNFLVIIISNQPDIALGQISEKSRIALKKKFEELIKKSKSCVDDIYYCYHHPDSINPTYPKECECRKPKPGMILTAANKYNIDLTRSWVIGDTDRDVNAGRTAGCKTILIKRLYSGECDPDFKVENLSQVIDIIRKNS